MLRGLARNRRQRALADRTDGARAQQTAVPSGHFDPGDGIHNRYGHGAADRFHAAEHFQTEAHPDRAGRERQGSHADRTVPWVTTPNDALVAIAGPHLQAMRTPVRLEGKGLRNVAEFTISKGKQIEFVMEYGSSSEPPPGGIEARKALKATHDAWETWTAKLRYNGPRAAALKRSLITVKALTYAPTGGIVAAPTTSLPEQLGGPLNWDYRYCWVRDATFTLLALIHAGYHKEAEQWKEWLKRAVAGSFDQLQTLYGVAGERRLLEWEAEWLPGYEGSAPVRIGNAASEQLQLDVFGELADCLHQARGARVRNHDREGFDLQ